MPVRSRSPAPGQSHISHPMGALRATREPLPSERETRATQLRVPSKRGRTIELRSDQETPERARARLVRHRRGTAHSRPYVSKQSSGRRVAQGRVEPPAIGHPGRTDEAAPHCASSSKRFGGRRKSTSPFGRASCTRDFSRTGSTPKSSGQLVRRSFLATLLSCRSPRTRSSSGT